MKYDAEVDAIGLKCPMPILKCKRGLSTIESDQILKIMATDKDAKQDFEFFCNQTVHKLVSHKVENDIYIFYIQKN